MRILFNGKVLVSALIVTLAISFSVVAQNKPTSLVQVRLGTQTPATLPAAYVGIPVNYVRSWQPQHPCTLESDVTAAIRTVDQVLKTTQYVDGLGRPLQTVNWQGSPLKKD